jgi:hypothetical protein
MAQRSDGDDVWVSIGVFVSSVIRQVRSKRTESRTIEPPQPEPAPKPADVDVIEPVRMKLRRVK